LKKISSCSRRRTFGVRRLRGLACALLEKPTPLCWVGFPCCGKTESDLPADFAQRSAEGFSGPNPSAELDLARGAGLFAPCGKVPGSDFRSVDPPPSKFTFLNSCFRCPCYQRKGGSRWFRAKIGDSSKVLDHRAGVVSFLNPEEAEIWTRLGGKKPKPVSGSDRRRGAKPQGRAWKTTNFVLPGKLGRPLEGVPNFLPETNGYLFCRWYKGTSEKARFQEKGEKLLGGDPTLPGNRTRNFHKAARARPASRSARRWDLAKISGWTAGAKSCRQSPDPVSQQKARTRQSEVGFQAGAKPTSAAGGRGGNVRPPRKQTRIFPRTYTLPFPACFTRAQRRSGACSLNSGGRA